MNWQLLARAIKPGLILIAVILLAMGLLRLTGLDEVLSEQWIDRYVRQQGLYGEGLFVLLGVAGMAIGFPRQAVSFLSGYAFGLVHGGLIALFATALAAMVNYLAAFIGVSLARWHPRAGKLIRFLRAHPFTSALLIRLLPFGSNMATSLAAGGARIPMWSFLAGSALGFIPQTLVFALLGSGMQVDPVWRTVLALALFLISGVLGVQLYRRYRDQVEEQNGTEEAR